MTTKHPSFAAKFVIESIDQGTATVTLMPVEASQLTDTEPEENGAHVDTSPIMVRIGDVDGRAIGDECTLSFKF